jgi:hypothetical protein
MQERKYKIEVQDGVGTLVNKFTGKPVPDDEPLFILRAQDVNALPSLMAYMVLCKDLHHREESTKSVVDFRNFRDANPERMKEPDA